MMPDPEVLGFAAVLVLIFGVYGLLLMARGLGRMAARPRPTPPNAAPVHETTNPAPGLAAKPYHAALRVHLCINGCGQIVRHVGTLCTSCAYGPGHWAEEITRDSWRGGASA